MKIRFEIELPEITTTENPKKDYWQQMEDSLIETYLYDYAYEVLHDKVDLKINQDDLKEFIKQVRHHAFDRQ